MRPGTPIELKSLIHETPLERLFQLYISAKRLETLRQPIAPIAARTRLPQSAQLRRPQPVGALQGQS